MTEPERKPRLSGWCSPCTSPRAHAECQDRMERKLLPPGFICECPKHTPSNGDTT